MDAYRGATYYDLQAVKPAPFKWHVDVYLFVSGLAGGAQVIAALADARAPSRMRSVVRNGRLLAFKSDRKGPSLLVVSDPKGDRQTPVAGGVGELSAPAWSPFSE